MVSNVFSSVIDLGRGIIGDGNKRRKTNDYDKNNEGDNNQVNNNGGNINGGDNDYQSSASSASGGDSIRRSIGDGDTTSNTYRLNNVEEGGQHERSDGAAECLVKRPRRYDDKRMYIAQHGGSIVQRGESTLSTALVSMHPLLSMHIVILLYKVLNSFSSICYFA